MSEHAVYESLAVQTPVLRNVLPANVDPATVPSGISAGNVGDKVAITILAAGVIQTAMLDEAAFDRFADILAGIIERRNAALRGRLEGVSLQ